MFSGGGGLYYSVGDFFDGLGFISPLHLPWPYYLEGIVSMLYIDMGKNVFILKMLFLI